MDFFLQFPSQFSGSGCLDLTGKSEVTSGLVWKGYCGQFRVLPSHGFYGLLLHCMNNAASPECFVEKLQGTKCLID